MPQEPNTSATSVLLIDSSPDCRAALTDQLKQCTTSYQILEADDGPSGLAICRSQHVDCVLLELGWPSRSGILTLVELVPHATRPEIAVIMLTNLPDAGVRYIAEQNGACACLFKQDLSGEELDRAIQEAVATVKRSGQNKWYRQL
jgi:sigma-B regulation protein RsbU (phosphoserine phosphatase)